jgi:hypothetical protein
MIQKKSRTDVDLGMMRGAGSTRVLQELDLCYLDSCAGSEPVRFVHNTHTRHTERKQQAESSNMCLKSLPRAQIAARSPNKITRVSEYSFPAVKGYNYSRILHCTRMQDVHMYDRSVGPSATPLLMADSHSVSKDRLPQALGRDVSRNGSSSRST